MLNYRLDRFGLRHEKGIRDFVGCRLPGKHGREARLVELAPGGYGPPRSPLREGVRQSVRWNLPRRQGRRNPEIH